MAVKIGDVTIRIGASTSELEKDLRKAERALQSSAQRFSRIGQDLSFALTAPLLGFGAVATQSFAEFERLTKSLEAITGDASLAAEQFERLKVIAEAPGLALPQVVSASAKLQAVGLSAEEAEKTITEYGNAVARSGGGAQEFDGAILALSQIAAKGKISAEELNQLGERIFEIRPALKAAFGTANSEELQKLGISAEDFISRTTAELAKLERVQGGLSNSFENFRDSINGSLATLGEAISESIDLPRVLDSISGAIKNVASAFENLTPRQKRFAIAIAGIVASLGPLNFLIGKVIGLYAQLSTAFVRAAAAIIAKQAATQKETAATAAGTITTTANTTATNAQAAATTVAATATDAATKKTITFAVATRAALAVLAPYALGIGLAVAAAYALSGASGNATESISDLNSVRQEGLKSAAKEVLQAESLIKVVRDETKSKVERNQALKDLAAINPQYFSGLTIEKDGIEKINKEYNDLIANIKQAATARAAEGRLLTLAEKKLDLQDQLTKEEQKAAQYAKDAAKFNEATSRTGTNYARTNLDNSTAIQNNIKKEIELIEQQSNKLADLAKVQNKPFSGGSGGGGGTGGKEIDEYKKKIQSLNEELINNDRLLRAGLISGPEAATEELTILEKKLETLVTAGLNPASNAVKDVKDSIEELRSVDAVNILPPTDPTATFEKAIGLLEGELLKGGNAASQATAKILKDTSNKVQQYYVGIGEGFVDLTGKFRPYVDEIAKVAVDITQIVNSAISSSLESVGVLIGNLISGEGAGSLKLFFNSILTVILDFAIGLGKQLIALGTATESLKKLFTNPIGAVIAGAGLIAVATIVKGIIAKGVPSLDIGTNLVKSDGLAMIHKGEQIIPANVVKGGYTGSGGGEIYGRLSGIDLLLSNEYAKSYHKRLR